jgi:sugar phosphate permease
MVRALARSRVHYAWVVLVVTFLVMLMAAGFRSTPGVFLKPYETTFGWSPGLIGGGIAISLLLYGAGAPFAAAIVERVGMRRTCAFALVAVAIASALTTVMTNAWEFYVLWGLVIGAATGAIAIPLAAIVANRWFVRRRGLVVGMLGASFAAGQLIFLPLLARVVDEYGWRTATMVVSVTALCVVAPLALVFLRDRPEQLGLRRYGETEDTPPPAPAAANPFRYAVDVFRDASKKRDFWLLASAFFICGATTNGLIGTHLIAACADHGLSADFGAGMLATIGIFNVVGATCSGWLTDRTDPRWLLFWYYGLRGLSLLGLNAALSDAGLTIAVFVVFYGLDWVATVPPTVALCRESFGTERASVVFAWVFASHQVGAAFAAWGAGASRGWFDSYLPAFMFAGTLGIAGAVISLLIGRRIVWREPSPAI